VVAAQAPSLRAERPGNGRELFYRDVQDNLVAAEISAGSSFAVDLRSVLFSARPYAADDNHANFDVDPDGPAVPDARDRVDGRRRAHSGG
jgi:hypothetical protein